MYIVYVQIVDGKVKQNPSEYIRIHIYLKRRKLGRLIVLLLDQIHKECTHHMKYLYFINCKHIDDRLTMIDILSASNSLICSIVSCVQYVYVCFHKPIF